MNEQDYWTVKAMDRCGGSFIVALAELVRRADAANLQKIKDTWPQYWEQYEARGKEMQEKGL
jgi:hypothetical protein